MHRQFLLLLLLPAITGIAQKKQKNPAIPQPAGYVSDYAAILSVKEKKDLAATLKEFRDESGNEIAVVTVNSVKPLTIEEYSRQLGNKWGIGKKNKNNGVLLLVAFKDRKVRISTGNGIITKLTDEECKEIIDELVVPEFKDDNYYEGIDAAVTRIRSELTETEDTAAIVDEPARNIDYSYSYPAPQDNNNNGNSSFVTTIFIIVGIGGVALGLSRSSGSGQGFSGTIFNRRGRFNDIHHHHYNSGNNSSMMDSSNFSSDNSSSSGFSSDSSGSSGSSGSSDSGSSFGGGSMDGGGGASGSW